MQKENLQRVSRAGKCLIHVRTPVAEKRGLGRLGNKNKYPIGKQDMKYQTIECFLSDLTVDVEYAKHGRERVWLIDVSVVNQSYLTSPERMARSVSI